MNNNFLLTDEHLWDYADGFLSAEENLRVEAYLHQHPEWQEHLDALYGRKTRPRYAAARIAAGRLCRPGDGRLSRYQTVRPCQKRPETRLDRVRRHRRFRAAHSRSRDRRHRYFDQRCLAATARCSTSQCRCYRPGAEQFGRTIRRLARPGFCLAAARRQTLHQRRVLHQLGY